MPKRSVVGEHAANLVGLERRVGHPSRWLSLGEIRKRSVALPLMWSVLVVVREIVLKGTLQATPANKPAAANALPLHRANPALRKCIQVRAARGEGDRLDAPGGQGVSPSGAELRVPVVNQVAGPDLGQPDGRRTVGFAYGSSRVGSARRSARHANSGGRLFALDCRELWLANARLSTEYAPF